jgi:hypothetical protein
MSDPDILITYQNIIPTLALSKSGIRVEDPLFLSAFVRKLPLFFSCIHFQDMSIKKFLTLIYDKNRAHFIHGGITFYTEIILVDSEKKSSSHFPDVKKHFPQSGSK